MGVRSFIPLTNRKPTAIAASARCRRNKNSVGDKCDPGCTGAGREFPEGTRAGAENQPLAIKGTERQDRLGRGASETNGREIGWARFGQ